MIITKGAMKFNFPELRGSLGSIRYPCFGERKLDGEATAIIYQNEKIWTTNKYGTCRSEWSKLDDIAEICEGKDITDAIFIAEMFYGLGTNGSLYQLLSHKEDDGLNLVIFDTARLIYRDGKNLPLDATLIDRKEIIGDMFGGKYTLLPKVLNNKAEVDQYFHDATEIDGYEGIVLKNFDGRYIGGPCDWVKIKNKDRTDYKVKSVDPTKERIEIGVPLTGPVNPGTQVLCTPNGNFVVVGVKVTNKYKKDLKPGDIVEIEHQGVLESGSLRHPVFIRKKGEGE